VIRSDPPPVAFIGNDIRDKFFPNLDPVGKTLYLQGRPFQVIGAAKAQGSVFGQSRDNFVMIPVESYFKMFGVRDVRTRLSMTPDTIFAIHSMTKPITSVAAMMLIDEGKLALADPVSKYIPSFAGTKVGLEVTKPDGSLALELVPPIHPVTIRDLMRHTSGISYDYIGGKWVELAYKAANIFEGPFDNREFAERIAKLPLARQPGTLWRYGHSTDVLGSVIEIISGQTLYEFLKQRILDPLGMNSTKFVLKTPEERARMARPLPSDPVLLAGERDRLDHPEWESGGGGLLSTITDYQRFSQMLLNGGELEGARLLAPKTVALMTSDQLPPTTERHTPTRWQSVHLVPFQRWVPALNLVSPFAWMPA